MAKAKSEPEHDIIDGIWKLLSKSERESLKKKIKGTLNRQLEEIIWEQCFDDISNCVSKIVTKELTTKEMKDRIRAHLRDAVDKRMDSQYIIDISTRID